METVRPAWWQRPELAGLAGLAYGLWSCRHLAVAWRVSPYDAGGALAFLAWTLPLFVCRRPPAVGWMLAGLAALGLAGAAELNVLAHVGLAMILAAWVQPVSQCRRAIWLVGAVAWMPALGYVLDGWPAAGVFGLRMLLALAALPLLLMAFRQNREGARQ